MTKKCNQFIFFFDPGTYREEDRIPIATGATREEAQRRGIPRLLIVAAEGGFWGLMSSIGVAVRQPNLTPEEFTHVGETIEAFFAKQISAPVQP